MIEAIAQITISQPIEKVFNYTIHPRNAKYWYDNVEVSTCNVEQVGVGTEAQLLTNIMGKNYDFNYSIEIIIPNEKLIMKTKTGPFPMESEYTFEKVDEMNTRVSVINRANPKGIPVFLVSMVKGKVQKTIEESVNNLKKILESN